MLLKIFYSRAPLNSSPINVYGFDFFVNPKTRFNEEEKKWEKLFFEEEYSNKEHKNTDPGVLVGSGG